MMNYGVNNVSMYNVMSILDAHNIAYVEDTYNKRKRIIICGNITDRGGHYGIFIHFDQNGNYHSHGHSPINWEKYGGTDEIGYGKKMIESCNDFNHLANYDSRNIRDLLRDLDDAVDYK